MLKLKQRKNTVFLTIVFFLMFCFVLVLANWQQIFVISNIVLRDAMASYQRSVVYTDSEYNRLKSTDIDVLYKEEDSAFSQFILDISQESYEVLEKKYNFSPDIRPVVVIYPGYNEFMNSLGWEDENKVSGVYQAGVIKIVSPKEWYPVERVEVIKKMYKNYGPIHHEMTHLFVDYMARGNYPDWYTEGLAQIEELKLLDIQWIDENNNNPDKLYSFKELEKDFYNLDNQALAYRQSLTMVVFLEQIFGENINIKILQSLGNGNSFSEALRENTGLTFVQLEEQYLEWINENWSIFFKEEL